MQSPLVRIANHLPGPVRRQLQPDRIDMISQFARFGAVGTLGFVVDAIVVYATRGSIGLYWGGAVAYLAAATTTWFANRIWTFRSAPRKAPLQQWMRFLTANALGFMLNRGAYALLISVWEFAWSHPIIAVAAGSITGMALNFHLSRRLVFR